MALRFLNTLSGEKEDFIPLRGKKVLLYTCGPTVHNYAHIGNFRAIVFYDLLSRYLRFRGFDVKHVMNITDVDDKTIEGALREKKGLREYTDYFIKIFLEDLGALGVRTPEIMPRATDCISEMVSLIKVLLDKGFAYRADNGDIYFRIAKFPDYSKLARLDTSAPVEKASERLNAEDDYTKETGGDFALWKAFEEGKDIVFWDTDIGKGRPGWHIECSAMAEKFLGRTIDIHCGGVDLIFPHHTNEIAQSEAGFESKLARYWLHNEHLLVDGRKMAKSLGNFYMLRDLLAQGISPRLIRYEFTKSHYRHRLDFRMSNLEQARIVLRKQEEFMWRINHVENDCKKGHDNEKINGIVDEGRKTFVAALDDDLNVSEGWAVIWDLMGKIAKLRLSGESTRENVISFLKEVDSIFGCFSFDDIPLSDDQQKLIEERNRARGEKNWVESDRLRVELESRGVVVEDVATTSRYHKYSI